MRRGLCKCTWRLAAAWHTAADLLSLCVSPRVLVVCVTGQYKYGWHALPRDFKCGTTKIVSGRASCDYGIRRRSVDAFNVSRRHTHMLTCSRLACGVLAACHTAGSLRQRDACWVCTHTHITHTSHVAALLSLSCCARRRLPAHPALVASPSTSLATSTTAATALAAPPQGATCPHTPQEASTAASVRPAWTAGTGAHTTLSARPCPALRRDIPLVAGAGRARTTATTAVQQPTPAKSTHPGSSSSTMPPSLLPTHPLLLLQRLPATRLPPQPKPLLKPWQLLPQPPLLCLLSHRRPAAASRARQVCPCMWLSLLVLLPMP